MRRAPVALLAALAFLLCVPLTAPVRAHDLAGAARAPSRPVRFHIPSPVALRVATGYHGWVRGSTWVPVRVALRNRMASTVRGTVSIPDQGTNNRFSAPLLSSVYQEAVVLPPQSAKQLTLYLPGRDVSGSVTVHVRVGGHVVASASAAPNFLDDMQVSIGALSANPEFISWLRTGKLHDSATLIQLNPSTLDPVPEALASFDVIALSNVDSAQLGPTQLAAVERYVRNGGSLLLVGGPDWQETLRPLPSSLLPGTLSGSRVVPDLNGLRALAGSAPPRQKTAISVLSHPRGTVLATERGIPLVVRATDGKGTIVYLAFDPSIAPIPRWNHAPAVLRDLVMQDAAPMVERLSSTGGRFRFSLDRFGPSMMRQELGNISGPASPSVALLILFAVLSTLIIGPLNFLILHRLGRGEFAWLTIPVLTVLCFGSSMAAVTHLKGNTTLLNTVSVIDLGGSPNAHAASMYVGLFSPVRGDYQLVWHAPALPQNVPPYSDGFGGPSEASSLGVRFEEGAQTAVDFPAMGMWSTRSVWLTTSVAIPGGIRSDLHVTPDGSIAGSIRNDTPLTIDQPAIVAGDAVLHLAVIPPHTTRRVHLRPSLDVDQAAQYTLLSQILGASGADNAFIAWDGDPWEEPQLEPEHSFLDRLVNVGERLPEARSIASTGQIFFVGWSTDSLGTFTVDGASPRRRDLDLLVDPLPIHLVKGPLNLRPGTIGATLVDARPVQPHPGCCFDFPSQPSIALGPGGSATFALDLPSAHPVHFHRLMLTLDAGGAEETARVQLYDWRARRWMRIRPHLSVTMLPHAGRVVSSSGELLVRITATSGSGDVVIADPRQDLQLSGSATVG